MVRSGSQRLSSKHRVTRRSTPAAFFLSTGCGDTHRNIVKNNDADVSDSDSDSVSSGSRKSARLAELVRDNSGTKGRWSEGKRREDGPKGREGKVVRYSRDSRLTGSLSLSLNSARHGSGARSTHSKQRQAYDRYRGFVLFKQSSGSLRFRLEQHETAVAVVSFYFCFECVEFLAYAMGLVRITSWYPNFNGSHFGLPPSEIHRMTGLPPKFV